jgi:transcription factor E
LGFFIILMLNKILKEMIIIAVGKSAEPIADLLETNKHVNEFNIAKKLGITINQTRNILYKVSNYGLVSSVRKKDKKKGWYTYSWKFEILKCLEFMESLLLDEKVKLDLELEERKKTLYYVCNLCNIEVNEEQALLMNFTCNECGDIFSTKDNSKLIKELKKSLSKIELKITEINLEIAKEKERLVKIKQRELKKLEKEELLKKEEASKKRKEKRDAMKAAKEKEAGGKKVVKKVIKKKSVAKKKVVKKKPAAKKKIVKKKSVAKKKVVKSVVKKSLKKIVKKVSKRKVSPSKGSLKSKKKSSK